ncbi:hypothetical protein BWQ96_10102 [Gracilariopsis chorda]|uniref:Uncharacterized protein n=1 Tax=Gracilariopsis chorda TaxID=448386 RepID=A0A2V3IDP6_9FLOR|nr:hypothetical protein BWQ96_10102 [Gracilariopsis chorda]|eukprot:PXF40194.1 hypothetical protein BWQ96_10102 [Gracilariopsis chorda]
MPSSVPSQSEATSTDPYVVYQLRKPNQRGTAVIPRFVPNTHAPAFSPANYRFARVWATDAATPLFNAPRSFEYTPSLGSESSHWSETSSYMSLSTLRTAPSERPPLLHPSHQQPIFLPRTLPNPHPSPPNFNMSPHFHYPTALSQSLDEDAVVDDLLANMHNPHYPTLQNAPSTTSALHAKQPPAHATTHHSSSTTRNTPRPAPHRAHAHPPPPHGTTPPSTHSSHSSQPRQLFASLLPALTRKRRSLWQWLFCSNTTAVSVAVPSIASSYTTRDPSQLPSSNRLPANTHTRQTHLHHTSSSKPPAARKHARTLEKARAHSQPRTSSTRPSRWDFLTNNLLTRDRPRGHTASTTHKRSTRAAKQNAAKRNATKNATTTSTTAVQNSNRIGFQHVLGAHNDQTHTQSVKQKDHRPQRAHHNQQQQHKQHKQHPNRQGPSKSNPARTGKNQTTSSSKSSRVRDAKGVHQRRANEERVKQNRNRANPSRADRPKDNAPQKDRPRARRTTPQSAAGTAARSALKKSNVIENTTAGNAAPHGVMRRVASSDSADPVTSRISSDLSSSTYGKQSVSDSTHSPAPKKKGASVHDMFMPANGIGSDVSSQVSGGMGKVSPVPYPNYQSTAMPVSSKAPLFNTNSNVQQVPSSLRPPLPRFPNLSAQNGPLLKEPKQAPGFIPPQSISASNPKKGMSMASGASGLSPALESGNIANQKSLSRSSTGGTISFRGARLESELEMDTASTGLTSLADESVSTQKSVSTRASAYNDQFPFVMEIPTSARALAEQVARDFESNSTTPDNYRNRKPIFQNSAIAFNAVVSPSHASSSSSKRFHSDWSDPHATVIDVFCQCSCSCVYEEECRRTCELIYGRSSSVSSSSRSRQGYHGFTSLPPAIHSNGMRMQSIQMAQNGNSSAGQGSAIQQNIPVMSKREARVQRRLVRANEVDELPDPYVQIPRNANGTSGDAALLSSTNAYAHGHDTWQPTTGAAGLPVLSPATAVPTANQSELSRRAEYSSHVTNRNGQGRVGRTSMNSNQASARKPPGRRPHTAGGLPRHSYDDALQYGTQPRRTECSGEDTAPPRKEENARRRGGSSDGPRHAKSVSGSHSYPRASVTQSMGNSYVVRKSGRPPSSHANMAPAGYRVGSPITDNAVEAHMYNGGDTVRRSWDERMSGSGVRVTRFSGLPPEREKGANGSGIPQIHTDDGLTGSDGVREMRRRDNSNRMRSEGDAVARRRRELSSKENASYARPPLLGMASK